MTRMWYVVDAATGIRYSNGYPTKPEALKALTDAYNSLPAESDIELDVELQPEGPWAYAIPTQTGR